MTTALRRPPSLEPRSRDGWLTVALAAIAAVPFVVATVRALGRGWMAIGDNGNFLIRSRDVLSSHHPLLGTWSSASIPIGENVNHPGPLLFDVFALPAKLGDAGGLAVGVLLLHLGCIAVLTLFAWRAGGLRLAAASLLATAAMAWSMGSELLYDPWNPHTLLFPFLALLVTVVATSRGDLLALPFGVALGSLIVQTHLSYALLVPPLLLWGLVWLVRRHRRAAWRTVLVASVVGAACWVQPLVDQVSGEGNLGALAGGLGAEQEVVGGALGVRIAAEVLAVPPWWGRDSFDEALRVPPGQTPLVGGRPNIGGLPSGAAAAFGMAVAALVVVGSVLVAHRRRDDVARACAATAAVALAVALVATVRLPVGGVGVPPHQVRYLWPLATFATAAAVLALVPRPWSTRALGVGTAVLAALTMPYHAVEAGPQADRAAIPIARSLCAQVERLEDEGTLVYDTSRLRFAEPWTSAVLACMQEHGVDFTVDDDVWARQLGTGRADEGHADARIFALEGEAALEPPDGDVRRVALVDPLGSDERRELAVLERSLADVDIELNDAGRAAADRGSLPSFADGAPSAEQLLTFGELASLLRDGLLVVPSARADDLARYTELRTARDRLTVGLFVDPSPYGAGRG